MSADTKSYLTIDPGRLLAQAPYLWDPDVGLGTVTHQTLGYLFPMGPYAWCLDALGVPDWVAQRLWLATLLFAAGAGMVVLGRVLRLPAVAVGVAAAAYQLSPYALHYAARISAILLPWAGLPWMVAFTVLAVRTRSWRWPALFAVVVALVGGLNATALLLAGLGPVTYLVWVAAARRAPAVAVAGAAARIGLLTAGVSLWWVAGLWAQGSYGIDILAYTETYETVARASSAPEVLRGLGYWFFYGSDKIDPWVGAGPDYQTWTWLVGLGYATVALALLAAALARFAARGFAVALVVVGTVVAVGAHPLDGPSLYGRAFLRFVETTPGQAMRSTPRAVPLVVLGLALCLGAGVAALAERWPRLRIGAPAAALAVLAAGMPPLLTGGLYTPGIQRDEHLPDYWHEAAAAIDAGPGSTRVLETPGSDFASYRWGGTIDPITPGLVDRSFVARELVPYGSPAGADLLNAYEQRLQDGVYEPATTAPIAALLGAGTVALRSDLQFERYRTPRPRLTWLQHQETGLSVAASFGPAVPNEPIERLPLLDEIAFATPDGAPDPPPVALFDVPDARPVVRAQPVEQPLVVAGDGAGLVDLAAAGLLDPGATVLYSATLDDDALAGAVAGGAELVLTDTNRRRGRRWGGVRENTGYTEQAGEEPLVDDPTDNRLPVFPGSGDEARSVTELGGVRRVQATGYGNPVTFTPEDRAVNALDGDPRTAWRVGAFADVVGERWEVELDAAVTAGRIRLLQPVTGPRNRFITAVRLRFDGGDPLDVALDATSRVRPGQDVAIAPRTFRDLSIEITATSTGELPTYRALTSVGFAEVGIDGVRVDELVRLPLDLLDRAGPGAAGAPLTVVLTRERANQLEPNRRDPELSIARRFELPTPRTMTLTGQVRLSGLAPDPALDAALGLPGPAAGGTAVTATTRIPGDPTARAAAALDGDPATAWTTPLGEVVGQAITLERAAPLTVDRLDLVVMADGRFSVPTRLAVSADGGAPVTVDVPPIADDPSREGATATVTVAVPTVTGRRITVAIDAVREVRSNDYFSELPFVMPVAIAELGLPGVTPAPSPATIPDGCRDDLVSVDGVAVPVRLDGSVADALARRPLALETCDGPLALAAGRHEVRTAVGLDVGLDVDRVVLRTRGPGAARPAPPTVTVLDEGRVSARVRIDGATGPFWLVLGQSHSDGWSASAFGRDLGSPTLVDGYANGWLVEPTGESFEVSLRWDPQRVIWVGIAGSAVTLVVCVALALWPGRTRPPAAAGPVEVEPAAGPRRPVATVVAVGVGALVLAGPLPAGAAVAAAVATRLVPRAVPIVALAAVAPIGAAAAYVVAKSVRYPIPWGLDWPQAFAPTHTMALAALAATVGVVAACGPVRQAGAADSGDRPTSTA